MPWLLLDITWLFYKSLLSFLAFEHAYGGNEVQGIGFSYSL